VFDGQGIPDSFNLAPLRGADNVQALVLGVGLCDLVGNTVIEPCAWDIEQQGRSVTFRMRHVFQRWGVDLERNVTLEGRTLRSERSIRNIGAERFAIVWFPHPFFPHLPAGTDDLIKLNLAVSLPENRGTGYRPLPGARHRSKHGTGRHPAAPVPGADQCQP
jgi:hypothetical protein